MVLEYSPGDSRSKGTGLVAGDADGCRQPFSGASNQALPLDKRDVVELSDCCCNRVSVLESVTMVD